MPPIFSAARRRASLLAFALSRRPIRWPCPTPYIRRYGLAAAGSEAFSKSSPHIFIDSDESPRAKCHHLGLHVFIFAASYILLSFDATSTLANFYHQRFSNSSRGCFADIIMSPPS